MEVCKISDVIRDARIRSGMTQEALAFGICSVSTLSKIENGRRMPQVRVFEALMDRMGESSERCLVYVGEHELQKKEDAGSNDTGNAFERPSAVGNRTGAV